jgi:hypothetical protein
VANRASPAKGVAFFIRPAGQLPEERPFRKLSPEEFPNSQWSGSGKLEPGVISKYRKVFFDQSGVRDGNFEERDLNEPEGADAYSSRHSLETLFNEFEVLSFRRRDLDLDKYGCGIGNAQAKNISGGASADRRTVFDTVATLNCSGSFPR